MNEVNKTLYIPLCGKAQVSKKGIILKDPKAEQIWEKEAFPIKGKMKSKWLAYNMAIRARVFDDWTQEMLQKNPDALVLHIGCGLDSRCLRVEAPYKYWIDGDFQEVIGTRKQYYTESEQYHMIPFNAAKSEMVGQLPDSACVIVIMEGISMYLKNEEVNALFQALDQKYESVCVLMDVYTVFGAKASKYKNPINEVGVTQVWGMDDTSDVIKGTKLQCVKEHSLVPDKLIKELKTSEQLFFKCMFNDAIYRKIYRLYELKK